MGEIAWRFSNVIGKAIEPRLSQGTELLRLSNFGENSLTNKVKIEVNRVWLKKVQYSKQFQNLMIVTRKIEVPQNFIVLENRRRKSFLEILNRTSQYFLFNVWSFTQAYSLLEIFEWKSVIQAFWGMLRILDFSWLN